MPENCTCCNCPGSASIKWICSGGSCAHPGRTESGWIIGGGRRTDDPFDACRLQQVSGISERREGRKWLMWDPARFRMDCSARRSELLDGTDRKEVASRAESIRNDRAIL